MKLVAILRVKNEILYINQCISRLSELVDEIIVLDNGSTDGTLDVYSNYPKIVEILETEGFNEGRDKIMLHEAAKKRNPDWILWLDGDEVFEATLTREVFDKYMNSRYNRIDFRMCNFWMDEQHYRVDGKYFQYTLHPQRSMWRNTDKAYFKNKKIHNGNIMGVLKPYYVSAYRLLHYGYANKEKAIQKITLYKKVDDTGRSYEHMRPEIKVIRLPYFEFKNKIIQKTFLYCNKYLLTGIYLWWRLYLKIREIITIRK